MSPYWIRRCAPDAVHDFVVQRNADVAWKDAMPKAITEKSAFHAGGLHQVRGGFVDFLGRNSRAHQVARLLQRISLAVRHACRMLSISLPLLIGIMPSARSDGKCRRTHRRARGCHRYWWLGAVASRRRLASWLSSLGIDLLQPMSQRTAAIVISSPNQRSIAIRTNWPFREDRTGRTRGESAGLALQTAQDTIAHSVLRNIQPDREVERGAMTSQDGLQAFRLRSRSREAVEDKPLATVQAQPILDQADNNFIRHQVAAFVPLSAVSNSQSVCPGRARGAESLPVK